MVAFTDRRVLLLAGVVVLLAVSGCLRVGVQESATPTVETTPGGESAAGLEADVTVTVVHVVDGDTIDVRYPDGTTDTVRLLGIDTPEVRGETSPDEFEGVPDDEAGRTCLRGAAANASAFLERRVAGRDVGLAMDPEADRRGGYGRLLAYVLVDGRNVNYRLVATGRARVYDAPFTQSDRFYAAETDAQRERRGLWRCRADE